MSISAEVADKIMVNARDLRIWLLNPVGEAHLRRHRVLMQMGHLGLETCPHELNA